ncbi:MAG: metal-dependent hydrolase [Gammaproteobacteria bacterium]
MPTIFTHPAIPLSLAFGLRRKISKRLLTCGVAASILPDLDVIAFRLGIPYAAEWGHRGFSHSLLFALLLAIVGAALAKPLRSKAKPAFWFLFFSTASHGVLDALTNGGLGIAFFWPFSTERFFVPWHPIEVAPLNLSRFLSHRGLAVLRSEFVWVWLPCMATALIAIAVRRCRKS